MPEQQERPMGFVRRMHAEFREEGQSLKEFAEEFNKLTDEEMEEYWKAFNEDGLPTERPSKRLGKSRGETDITPTEPS